MDEAVPTPDTTVAVILLQQGASPPGYAHTSDGAADLRSVEDLILSPGGGRARVRTAIAIAIPPGHVGLVLPRSGLAANHGVTCLNAPGLIDSGYRGEVQVVLVNTDPSTPYHIHAGDRIAQLLVQPYTRAGFTLVEELPEGDRAGGFGHTGR